MSDARIVEVSDDGVATYRASAISSCFNALLMARLGYDGTEAPAWLQTRFQAGHDHEPLILRKLEEEYGFTVSGQQLPIELKCGSKARIVGHIDGLHNTSDIMATMVTHVNGDGNATPRPLPIGGNELLVVDAKALAVSTFASWNRDRFKAFPYYAWQQRAYMLGLGATGLIMAVKNKNTDQLNVEYFTASYMDDIVTRADILKKIMDVEKAAQAGAESIFERDCTPMFPCPYFFMHPENDGKKVKQANTLTEEARAQLGAIVLERTALKTAATNVQAQLDAIDETIRDLVEGAALTEKTPHGTLTTYHSGYSSPNWGAIAIACGLDGPDDAKNAFYTAKTSDKLSVKVTVPKGKK